MTLDESYRIDELMTAHEYLPDGAFFAALAEHGIESEDILEAQERLAEEE